MKEIWRTKQVEELINLGLSDITLKTMQEI